MSSSRARSQAASRKKAARSIAERYAALRAQGVPASDAERQAFTEYGPAVEDESADVYEAFLRICAPERRRGHGVYSTPAAVVQAQVRLVDDALRRRLGCADGLADARVMVVDPAVGTGAYPLAVLEHVGEAATLAVRGRMRLFEALPGAAALARTRGLLVEEIDALVSAPIFEAPVVVCLGNPPYRRGLGSDVARRSLDGFVGDAPGVHLKNLYNAYIYFWRWVMQVVFERRSGPGVVCLVTAASYLRGPAFAGMRRTLRAALDELYVIDLEGDPLAARASDNVFPVRTPVAIALGLRVGAMSAITRPAVVRYVRLDGSADQKLGALGALGRLDDGSWQSAPGGWGQPLMAVRRTAYADWPALTELFPWQLSGAQFKRTWPIAPTREVLEARWRRLLELPAGEREAAFGVTRDRTLASSPPDLRDSTRRLPPLEDVPADADCPTPVRYAYRAFDRHWALADARLGDFLRPALWRSASPRQVFLTTPLTAVLGPGPAAVATRYVPDLDHFRGSFGARGVIPLWLDAAATEANVSSAWLERLAERFGFAVSGEALLAYCYALLATRGYVRRFAEELRMPGARIPLTNDPEVFRRASRHGSELLRVHMYERVAPARARNLTPVADAFPREYRYDPHSATLWVGDARFGPLAPEVWDYSVSGYAVLAGWLRHRTRRRGRSALDRIMPTAWTAATSQELLELIWLLEATLSAEPALNEILDQAASGGRPLSATGRP